MTDTERNDLGRALYHVLNRDTNPIAWDALPDNRQERYRIAAVEFAGTKALIAYLVAMRKRVAV